MLPQIESQSSCWKMASWQSTMWLGNCLRHSTEILVMFNLELAVMPNTSWKSFKKKKPVKPAQFIVLFGKVWFFPVTVIPCLQSTQIFKCAVGESATHSPVSRSGGSLTPMDPDRTRSVSCFPVLHRHVLGSAWKCSFVCLCLYENYRCLWGWAFTEQRSWRLCFGSWLPTWWLNA